MLVNEIITNCNYCTKCDDGFCKIHFKLDLFSYVDAFLSESILYICLSLFTTVAGKKIHTLYLRKVWVGSRCNNGFKVKGHKKWYLLWLFQFKTVTNLKKTTFKVSYHEWMLFCSSLVFWKRSVSAGSSDGPVWVQATRYSPVMAVSLSVDRHSDRVGVCVWWLFPDVVKIQFNLAEQITSDHMDQTNCCWNAWQQPCSVPRETFWSAVKHVSVTHGFLGFCH